MKKIILVGLFFLTGMAQADIAPISELVQFKPTSVVPKYIQKTVSDLIEKKCGAAMSIRPEESSLAILEINSDYSFEFGPHHLEMYSYNMHFSIRYGADGYHGEQYNMSVVSDQYGAYELKTDFWMCQP